MLIVNFKCYRESIGKNALDLALLHARIAQEFDLDVFIAVNFLDLREVLKELAKLKAEWGSLKLNVLAQHCDAVDLGAITGSIAPVHLKELGVRGVLLNHAEKPLAENVLIRTVEKCRENELIAVVCAQNADVAVTYSALLKANFFAVEPPELIGGEISVVEADPQIIADASKKLGKQKLLVGAGIKSGKDVQRSLELGACGVLVASGVVKSLNPEIVLRDLCLAFKK